VLGTDLGKGRVTVVHGGRVAEAADDLGADDRGDLLRRPGGPSTTRADVGLTRQVEHLDDYAAHAAHPFIPTAPNGQARTQTPQPEQASSSTVYPAEPG
jgi:hypothetical protein